MTPLRFINKSTTESVYLSYSIQPEEIFTVSDKDRFTFASDQDILRDIVSGMLVVNNGSTDLEWSEGLSYTRSILSEPPKTKDGDWHIVTENFAHVTGNDVINWTLEKHLDCSTKHSERLLIPSNKKVTVNFVEAGSDSIPTSLCLEYFKIINGGHYRVNLDIRVSEMYCLVSTVDAVSTDTTMTVETAYDNLFEDTINNVLYGVETPDGELSYHFLTSVSDDPSVLTFDNPFGRDLPAGTKLAVVDRPIGQSGSTMASSDLNWISPPEFYCSSGLSYLKLTIFNNSIEDAGLVFAVINGWQTPLVGGD
jgi:hypothetical protein